jgi:two-component system, NtrC family, C4-dicarboxylate transport response regulator DctD
MTSWDDSLFSDVPGALGRVLLVDDEPELRRVSCRQLTKAGFDVTEAANGLIALELVRTQKFDVVVSDMRMPDMGGLELVDRLSAEAPELPVVLVSGYSGFADVETARAYGVVDCLEKPVALKALIGSVSLAVGIHRGFLKHPEAPRESETRLAVPALNRSATVVPIRRGFAGV